VQDVAATKTKTSKSNASHFTRPMQTEAQRAVNELMRLLTRAHNGTSLALPFRVAHPLWSEEIPPPSGAMD
jgi:hypothetical protein